MALNSRSWRKIKGQVGKTQLLNGNLMLNHMQPVLKFTAFQVIHSSTKYFTQTAKREVQGTDYSVKKTQVYT